MSEPTIDALTGLLKAGPFHEQLEETARKHESLVLVAMDLDHFKVFNDRYGHVAGDEWLRLVGERFNAALAGEGNLIARYGGDEFMAAVCTGDLMSVYEKAEGLRQGLERDAPAITVDGQTIQPGMTISLGLAGYPANASDVNDLLDKARDALSSAKIAGANRVCFYQETDTLTGLANAYACQRILEEGLAAAREKRDALSVFLLDIDRFKEINDEYGHRAGDEVLKRLGHILDANFKDLGTPGRMAGDEFIVILPGQRADSAFILAEEVRRLVDDSEISVTMGSGGAGARSFTLRFHISGGIANYPNDASEQVDLLRKADEALYRSKQTGRNRICLPASAQMVTKTSYYTQIQLERLATLARRQDKTEAFLLREALDDLLRKYGEEE